MAFSFPFKFLYCWRFDSNQRPVRILLILFFSYFFFLLLSFLSVLLLFSPIIYFNQKFCQKLDYNDSHHSYERIDEKTCCPVSYCIVFFKFFKYIKCARAHKKDRHEKVKTFDFIFHFAFVRLKILKVNQTAHLNGYCCV